MPQDQEMPKSDELLQLINNKEDGYNYRERRQQDWLENYMLYRDKVTYNRLTQRQSVNLPLMKQTVRSLLKDVDDMPLVYLENLDNDKQKEVFQNEYWNWTVEQNRMELQDIVDKKQVFLFGRSFDQWQIMDGRIVMTVQDPQDILVSRYTDPTNIHTSRFLIHTHIYKSISQLEANPDYDKKAIKELKAWHSSDDGLVKVADNLRMSQEKNKKLEAMGMWDLETPVLGETIVEITLHFVYDTRDGSDDEELFLKVEADNQKILMNKPLEEVIGETEDNFFQNHFPYNTWADDIERQDFWSDGVADTIRTPNKVLNSWWSQIVENRTLRNFGMHYYDSTVEGYSPNTFNPQPWGWYPVPGKPQDTVQKVDVPDLGTDNMDELQFLLTMSERASGATATQQGAKIDRQVTLGEVQLALGEAKERVKGMSKFYTQAWKDRATMFLKLIEAAGDKLEPVKIYKKGRNTDRVYEREITPNDWMSKSGYHAKVWSQDERNEKNVETLQKLNATVTLIPGNQKLIDIYQMKLLEYADLNPEEINAVMETERQKREQQNNIMEGQNGMAPNSATPGMTPAVPTPQPTQPLA